MVAQSTKTPWIELFKRVRKALTQPNGTGTDLKDDERLRKMIQQREEFRKWANTF